MHVLIGLQVIGNMAPAVIPASPALRAAVLECVNHPAADPLVQQAAIQAYRLTLVPEEASCFIFKCLWLGNVLLLCCLWFGVVW